MAALLPTRSGCTVPAVQVVWETDLPGKPADHLAPGATPSCIAAQQRVEGDGCRALTLRLHLLEQPSCSLCAKHMAPVTLMHTHLKNRPIAHVQNMNNWCSHWQNTFECITLRSSVATRRSNKMVYVTAFGGTPAACMSASTCFAPSTSPACCTERNACQNGCHEPLAAGCPSHWT